MLHNHCCQCGEAREVWSKYAPPESRETSTPVPITWVCINCDRHVCINCVLTIPGSLPVEIYDRTYCSEFCRYSWLSRHGISDETEDREELGVTPIGEAPSARGQSESLQQQDL